MSETADIVLFETDSRGVATVTLNRPQVHNAFNDAVIARLSAIWTELAGRGDVRVVVLTGAGKRFSAGGDLDWMRKAGQATPEPTRLSTLTPARLLKGLYDLPQATLALEIGHASGKESG